MFTAGPVSLTTVTGTAIRKLMALRDAFTGVQQMHDWLAGVSLSDLEGLGFTASDASTLLSAMADAAALAQIYETGLPPATYPQPASAYPYASSQAQVIGPQ